MSLKKTKNEEASTADNCKEQIGFFEKIKAVYRTITIEFIVVFYTLPSIAAVLATQNLSLEKACRINLGLNETVCDGMANQDSSMYDDADEVEVQKLVSSLYAWKDVVQSVVPAMLLLFFGSWSDRHHNRKPCLILPVIGSAISSIGYLICTYFFNELSAEYCMISDALPIALTGNWFVFYLGMYSYVSEISSVETRTVRLGAITTLFNVCTTAGLGASGFVYAGIGYYGVFSMALGMYMIALVYAWIAVKEKPKESQPPVKKVGLLRDFFETKHITNTFKVVFQNPDKKKRKRMYCIMILVGMISGPWYGESNVMYLFMRYRFQWSEIDFSIYSFYNSILHTVATIFSLSFFSKYLQMDDALMGVMSSMSYILSAFIYFFATSASTFYIGSIVEVFNGTSYIAMRSIISKLVTPDELGKVNSLFGLCEALIPLAYGPLYNLLYKWTIDILPGAFFLCNAALTFPGVIIFLWLYKQHKQDRAEEEKDAAQKQELLQIHTFAVEK